MLLMTQMRIVESIPVDFVKVGKAIVSSKRVEEPLFVAINKDGIFAEKQKVDIAELKNKVKGREIILRADRNIPYGKAIQIVASLRQNAKNISLEVQSE